MPRRPTAAAARPGRAGAGSPRRAAATAAAAKAAAAAAAAAEPELDAIVVGAGYGGLTTATQLAARGAKVVCLEKYVIPGGSGGRYERAGYR